MGGSHSKQVDDISVENEKVANNASGVRLFTAGQLAWILSSEYDDSPLRDGRPRCCASAVYTH